jgi:hypothetical protein
MTVSPLLSPFEFMPSPVRSSGQMSAHVANTRHTTHDQHRPIDYFSMGRLSGDDEEDENGSENEEAEDGSENEEEEDERCETEGQELDAAAHVSRSEIRDALLKGVQR